MKPIVREVLNSKVATVNIELGFPGRTAWLSSEIVERSFLNRDFLPALPINDLGVGKRRRMAFAWPGRLARHQWRRVRGTTVCLTRAPQNLDQNSSPRQLVSWEPSWGTSGKGRKYK
jgi:hypothetical protein